MVIKLPLKEFLEIVLEMEANGGTLFAETSNALGNYLASPLNKEQFATIDLFLARWNSRRRTVDWNGLRLLWTPEMQQLSRLLGSLTLANCDFGSNLAIGEHEIPFVNVVELMYDRLRMIDGIGPTNASKLLSLSLPDFFVMWDRENIRGPQNIRSRPKDYGAFMLEMHRYAKQLIDEVSEANKCSFKDAVVWLENQQFSPAQPPATTKLKPIPKLLDEFNYWLPQSSWFKAQMSGRSA